MEFLNPSWLWVTPFVLGVLFYAYAKRGSAQELPASSTMFLKQLSTSSASRRLPVIPPRLLFDLLVSLLLIFALVGLLSRDDSTRVAIVIDNSLSMAARNGSSTSIDKAVKLASKTVNLNYADASAQLFITSPTPESIGAEHLDRSALKQALQGIEVSYGDDTLESTISLAASSDAFDVIEVFTDRPIKGLQQESTLKLNSVANLRKENANNFSIQAVNRTAYDAKARVSSFSNKAANIKVTAKSLTGNSSFSKKLTLEPLEKEDIVFPIKLNDGPVKVSLTFEEQAREGVDDLLLDNTAYLGLPGSSEDILLVSKFSPQELKLDTIEGISIGWRKPKEYQKEEKPKVYIFHNWAPPKLPSIPSMFINDFSGIDIETSTFEKAKPLSYWNESHEVLKYLSMPDVRLKTASFTQLPKWSQSLLEISGRSIAFAGERKGVRYVYIGFEVFPFRGVFTAVPTIAFLNTINWLEKDTSSISKRAYSLIDVIAVPDRIQYISPSEEQLSLIENSKYKLRQPGVVKETYSSSTRFQAVNFFSETESNLQSQQVVSAQSITKGESEKSGELLTIKLLKYALWLSLIGSLLLVFKLPKLKRRAA